MCGFTGFLNHSSPPSAEESAQLLQRMSDPLRHRGPDDSGLWFDADAGIGLAHRRLSVLDLSAAGHQPMTSPSGRYVLAFNGEIYNHLELRAALDREGPAPVHPLADAPIQPRVNAPRWQGHADTETLVTAIDGWGIGETLRRCRGMFALALWDRQDRLLYLARDRLGEKPLYYGWQQSTLLFGSELKALRAHPAFEAQIDRSSLAELLRLGYVPGPATIYTGVLKLPPGTFIALGAHRQSAEPVVYWSLADAALRGQMSPFQGGDSEAIEALDQRLRGVIAGQMVADVPIGSFLSGGIDSSLITALMQDQSRTPIQTFSVGFREAEYNEAPEARAIAQHLGTTHTELLVDDQEALRLIPDLPTLYDEPFADASQIPTHLVARLARQTVTVALTGDGGDELFGGYNRHTWPPRLWRRLRHVPLGLRRLAGSTLSVIPPELWDTTFRHLAPILPQTLRYRSPGDKLHKLSRLLAAPHPEALYLDLIAQTKDAQRLVLGASASENLLTHPELWPSLRALEHRMMFLDSATYLPDDLMVKLDRATMGVSLEGRTPFLDHELVEFGWSLPLSLKIRDGQGKWILRQLLNRYVPAPLTDRPKMGFGVPMDRWLRGPLKEWAESLINPARIKEGGFLHGPRVRHLWQQHQSGRRNHAGLLWAILMFEAFRDQP